jgi:hypothetical protein
LNYKIAGAHELGNYNKKGALELRDYLILGTVVGGLVNVASTSPTSPPFSKGKRTVYCIQTVCGGGGEGVLSCVVDHILQEFNTLFLTRFRTYKIATPPQTKTPVKATFRDWFLYSFLRPWCGYRSGSSFFAEYPGTDLGSDPYRPRTRQSFKFL